MKYHSITDRPHVKLAALLACAVLCGCAGSKRLEIEGDFPVPLMEKAPVNLGIHLDETLTSYVHKESIEKNGDWEVVIGPAQQQLFNNLAAGIFQGYTFVSATTVEPPLDGVLKPIIQEVQFSLPAQTRSDYYEVWIRYNFELYDRAGSLIGTWNLPAYGKANQNNYGASGAGLQAAALSACRDAMAFFSINFTREPVVQKWLTAGKPLVPISAQQPPNNNPPAPSESESGDEKAAQGDTA